MHLSMLHCVCLANNIFYRMLNFPQTLSVRYFLGSQDPKKISFLDISGCTTLSPYMHVNDFG